MNNELFNLNNKVDIDDGINDVVSISGPYLK
jgi:hypothetical protein